MKQKTLYSIIKSWSLEQSDMSKTQEILDWVEYRNKNVEVNIFKNKLSQSDFWFYDKEKGSIHNKNNSFFSIVGFEKFYSDGFKISQPIIVQKEIGFLGIICKEFDGVMHFLMQAKIEPGNINKIQISPTIQATKSNFTQKHGGAKPPYLEYFENAFKYEIVVDQIQSEQSSRFYKKRNRNIIICVEEEIEVISSHRWVTLGQLKKLMRIDNLVNMDTRTVISCVPYYKFDIDKNDDVSKFFNNKSLYNSIFKENRQNILPEIYHYINNYKMFDDFDGKIVPLHALDNWEFLDEKICCKNPYPYQVIFCDISMEGREVKRWTQPLFEAMGIATFGLICCEHDNVLKFLVRATAEIGCFDGIELAPTVQREAIQIESHKNTIIDALFDKKLKEKTGIIFDNLLSEEGGRFYHEQNRNVILKVCIDELQELPNGYFLVDYNTLNELVQVNNTLNIQLRNLLSLLEV